MELELPVWSLFTKKTENTATCNECSQDYSYRSGASNLRKHWFNKHAKHIEEKFNEPSENNSDNSDAEEQDKTPVVKKMKVWDTFEYFGALDLEIGEATCKICNKVVTMKDVFDLKQHVRDHGYEPSDGGDDEYVPEVHEKLKKRRYKSKIWESFCVLDDKMAECLKCHNAFNYGATITNLRRHLVRKHPEAVLPSQSGEDEPKEMDAIYLNEELLEESSNDAIAPPTPKRKVIYIPNKRNSKIPKEQVRSTRDTSSKEQVHSTGNSSSIEQFPSTRNTCYKEKEQVQSTRDTSSIILELPSEPAPVYYTPKPMGSLDYFGQYIISLLKELPKPVSDQLQGQIINQILTSKMALVTQKAVDIHEAVKRQKNEIDTNVTEPTNNIVGGPHETAEDMNVITECVIDNN